MSKSSRNSKRNCDDGAGTDSSNQEGSPEMQDVTKLLAFMVNSQRQAEERRHDEEVQQSERQHAEEERRVAERQAEEEHRRLEKEVWEKQREDDNKRWEILFNQQQEQFRLFKEHTEREMEHKDKELEERALRSIRMPKWKEADDIESFLLAFERQMLTQGPPKNKWVTHLVPLLSGKALKAYTGLSEAASKEYGTVKETILHGVSPLCRVS